MFYRVIWQCAQSLKNLEICLDKAEQHAAAKKFDVNILMTSRLAPDQDDFIYQIQSACDMSKPRPPGCLARLHRHTRTTSERLVRCARG
jgi:hypothetical protein